MDIGSIKLIIHFLERGRSRKNSQTTLIDLKYCTLPLSNNLFHNY